MWISARLAMPAVCWDPPGQPLRPHAVGLPHRMFLCGGGSSLDLLMHRLEDTDWYKALPFTRKPSVHHIRPEQVAGITDTTGRVNDHTYITAMGLLRVGMDTMQFAGSGGSIRDKIDKMLSV